MGEKSVEFSVGKRGPPRSAKVERDRLLRGLLDSAPMSKPERREYVVAVVGGDGVDQTSYGALWWTLEQRYRVPFTRITTDALRSGDLSPFNVIVIPSASPATLEARVGRGGALRAWVQAGGNEAWFKRLRDPAIRKRVAAEMRSDHTDWENLLQAAGGGGPRPPGPPPRPRRYRR